MRRPRRLIVVSYTSSHIGRGLLEGIREYCQRHGQWQFQLEPNAQEPSAFARMKRSIAQWNPDGVLAHIVG